MQRCGWKMGKKKNKKQTKKKTLWPKTGSQTYIISKMIEILFTPVLMWHCSLKDMQEEDVRQVQMNRCVNWIWTGSPFSTTSLTVLSWLLEIIGEAHIWRRLLLFLLPLYCPVTAFNIHLPAAAALCGSCSGVCPIVLNIIFLSSVLVHNHISFSIDRLFCFIFYCYCICAMSGFLILWYGCRDQSVMLLVSKSERSHLLYGCYLSQMLTHTHTHTHTMQLSCPFPFSLLLSHHAHSSLLLFLLWHAAVSLTHTFWQFLGSTAVIRCCHLTCYPNIQHPPPPPLNA